jgi:hypothetical protein
MPQTRFRKKLSTLQVTQLLPGEEKLHLAMPKPRLCLLQKPLHGELQCGEMALDAIMRVKSRLTENDSPILVKK